MTKIIHQRIQLNTNAQESFKMFTQNAKVEKWLAENTDIEPCLGRKYELFWDKENKEINSTRGCRITAIEENQLLSFDWKGPSQFAHFMNDTDPLTHVTVTFIPELEKNTTEVHLIHTGWGSDAEWEEARTWFDSVWENALNRLVAKVIEV